MIGDEFTRFAAAVLIWNWAVILSSSWMLWFVTWACAQEAVSRAGVRRVIISCLLDTLNSLLFINSLLFALLDLTSVHLLATSPSSLYSSAYSLMLYTRYSHMFSLHFLYSLLHSLLFSHFPLRSLHFFLLASPLSTRHSSIISILFSTRYFQLIARISFGC